MRLHLFRIERVNFRSGSWTKMEITKNKLPACQEGYANPIGLQMAKNWHSYHPVRINHRSITMILLIYVLDYENDQIEKLPVSIEGDFDPDWSPDGDRLLFTSLRSGTSHIYLYNFSDESFEELSDTRYADMQPTWNPSGKQIAFVREIYFYHVWIMSDKGQTQFQFSPNGAVNDLWPTWSSNGDLILYSKMQSSPTIPWLVGMSYEDRNTAAEYRIPQLGINDPGPVARANLSYDNKWIAFESWPDGKNHDIYRMDLDGQNQLRMTTDPGYDTDPIWRPAE